MANKMKPDIKHFDISMENYEHMYCRFEKLAGSHPLFVMFSRQLDLTRLKKELVRKRRKAVFFLVKQFLLAECFNPVLFLEMRRSQDRLENLCQQSEFNYLWQPLFTDLIKTIDYQMLDQYGKLLSMLENRVVGDWLSRIRRAVGQEKYGNISRLLSDIVWQCESVKSLELFLECYAESFGSISPISEAIRILFSMVPAFCSQVAKDGDSVYLLEAWELLNCLMRKKHLHAFRTVEQNVFLSHIQFLGNLLQKGFGTDILYAACPTADKINLQNRLSLEDKQAIHLSATLLSGFPPEQQEVIQNKLATLHNRPIYHFFMGELIIRYCGQVESTTVEVWLDLIDECINLENRGVFDFSETINAMPHLSILSDISDCVQSDEQSLLLKYTGLMPRMKAWPRLVLLNLMFKMILRTRNLECLSDLINIFKKDPQQFFDIIGPCPGTDAITDRLEEIFQTYFREWILHLLRDYGHHKSHHAEKLGQVIDFLESPEDHPVFLNRLQTGLSRNIDLANWLNDVWRINHQAA